MCASFCSGVRLAIRSFVRWMDCWRSSGVGGLHVFTLFSGDAGSSGEVGGGGLISVMHRIVPAESVFVVVLIPHQTTKGLALVGFGRPAQCSESDPGVGRLRVVAGLPPASPLAVVPGVRC